MILRFFGAASAARIRFRRDQNRGSLASRLERHADVALLPLADHGEANGSRQTPAIVRAGSESGDTLDRRAVDRDDDIAGDDAAIGCACARRVVPRVSAADAADTLSTTTPGTPMRSVMS